MAPAQGTLNERLGLGQSSLARQTQCFDHLFLHPIPPLIRQEMAWLAHHPVGSRPDGVQ
jgi:hypothetical protein